MTKRRHTADVEADEQARGNDRSVWPYVVEGSDLDDLAHTYCRAGIHGAELTRALESVGWSRSQPAPRTVSAAQVAEASAAAWNSEHAETLPWAFTSDERKAGVERTIRVALAALGIEVAR